MSTPIDSLKFIAARADDLLEYIEDQCVVTNVDTELADITASLRQEIRDAAAQHITDRPLVYSDGVAVRMELSDAAGVVHVRFPSHAAKGGNAA